MRTTLQLALTLGLLALLAIMAISQQKRLDDYSAWYCTQVYGLNADCTGNYTKGVK